MDQALLAFFDLILILFLQDLSGRLILRYRLKRLGDSAQRNVWICFLPLFLAPHPPYSNGYQSTFDENEKNK